MDEVDGRIVARLYQDPLASIADLCETAGLTRNAVKARLDRLQEADILRGFATIPNASLFAKTDIVAVYGVPEGGNPASQHVLAIDDVFEMTINHDGKLAALIRLDDPSDGTPTELDRLMGAPPERTFVREAPPLDPPGPVLSPRQWRVIEAMLEDPRASTGTLAEAAGLSRKVVRRLRPALVQGRHVTIQPILLLNRAVGGTLFEIYAQGPAAAEPATLQQVLGPSWPLDRLEEPVGVLVMAQATSLGEAVAARNRVAQLPGIEHAELILAQDHAWDPDMIRAACQAKRADAEDHRRRAGKGR